MTEKLNISEILANTISRLDTHYSPGLRVYISIDDDGLCYGWCSVNEEWLLMKQRPTDLLSLDALRKEGSK